ncbi:PGR5-like protein 1B, chloroplastic isoform X4 [Musa acuminata AAA Group]|uniref:PGR5-like protein 1B, chloroplastic isoform X4 n=1 Tax=Musa acuminata AAA Group TaxID=214697 RepID=UPI0031CEA72D
MPLSSSSSSSTAAAAAPAFHVLRARPLSAHDRLRPRPRGGGRRSFSPILAVAADAPSCLYVGPIETASKEMLEALYQQLKLRLYGSKSVVKYPRCSLRRQSTYADAEEDPSQAFALASVCERSTFGSLMMVNKTLILGLGHLVGYPLAFASIQALQGLWRNELVAMKGSCPNCGEEVFTFVRAENSTGRPHRAACHVCECSLEFQTKVEQSFTVPGKRWVYGRVYLVQQT